MKCTICNTEDPQWAWTDTHGIAQCWTCGAPYRLYHYEGDPPRRIEKPPTLLLKDEYIELCQRFHRETGYKMPGGFSFSQDYERASTVDRRAFNDWMDQHGPQEPNEADL